jgi:hypothetical protein
MRSHRQRTASLGPQDWERIWAFACRYTEASRELFEQSLRRREHLCSAVDGAELVGIAAVDTAAVRFEDRTVVRIFTSNTLIAESHRGRNLIQRWALGELVRARLRHPLSAIYWFFDTFSYRSYLLLCRNFHDYWPRRDTPTPPALLRLMDAFATPLYGDAWDVARGLVRANGKRLKEFVSPIDDRARANPDVQFFEARNPGHADGEMLVCLAPLHARNCALIAGRALARAARRSKA